MTETTNAFVELLAPTGAGLADIIDWRHPLLRGAGRSNPAAALLMAWRREQGYRWFFDRSDIAAMLKSVPAERIRHWAGFIEYLHNNAWKKRSTPVAYAEKKTVPFDVRGRPVWTFVYNEDNEYIGVVNRFHWMSFAAAAAKRTGDAAGEELIFRLMDDWIEACPAPVDVIEAGAGVWPHWYKPWAPLNTALRARNWFLVLSLLWDSKALTAERFGRYVRALRQHLLHLGMVSPRVDKQAAGNHFLMESESLLYLSVLPWLKESASARKTAIFNFERCVRNQVLPDGVHVECAPGYHRGCMQWFGMPMLLCRLNKWPLDAGLKKRILSMLDFGMHMVNPDGRCSGFADSGRSADGHASEWLLSRISGRQLPMEITAPGDVAAFIRNLPDPARSSARRIPLAMHFPSGGFAAARNSWEQNATAFSMKLDSFGGAHSHADFLSVSFSWKGRLIIDEQGTRSYNNDRAAVERKLAPAHSVLLLGRRDMLHAGKPDYYWDAARVPNVTVSDVRCAASRNGCMSTGARVSWDEHTWWSRYADFDPEKGLIIHDRIECLRPEPVRIQFYVLSTKVRQTGPGSISTADRNMPNITMTVTGEPEISVEIQPVVIYNGFFREMKASLVTFRAPRCKSGRWQTSVCGR